MLRSLKLMKGAVASTQNTRNGAKTTFWMDLQIYLIALLTVLIMSSTLAYTLTVDEPGTQSSTSLSPYGGKSLPLPETGTVTCSPSPSSGAWSASSR
jgi:hypothetical protein